MIYVEELIGPDTVNTMPLETVRAFQEHGEVKQGSILQGIDDANALLADLAAAGVDATTSSRRSGGGVQKFADSFAELLDASATRRARWRRRDQAANPLLGCSCGDAPSRVAVIFGAWGDLTSAADPALYSLAHRKLLPEEFAIVGVARSPRTSSCARPR